MTQPQLYRGILGPVARLVDGAVAAFAPTWGRNRLLARAEHGALLAYDAARQDRTRRSRPQVGSADDDLLPDLAKLRSNSRTMVRDDANAAAILQVMRENVVGTGIAAESIVQPGKATGFTKAQADDWNDACEQLFATWSGKLCDATGHTNFAGLQMQALTEGMRDGEWLCHRGAKQGRSLLTVCEFIDVDRLADPLGVQTVNVRSGVQVDEWGEATHYWITPRHPSEAYRPGLSQQQRRNQPVAFARMDGDMPSIIHGFIRTRSGQRRGVPMFSSSFGLIEALNDIVASETVATRAAAKICGVITSAAPLAFTDPTVKQQDDGQWSQKMESGTWQRLRPGESMTPFVPNRPGNTWEAFCNRVLRSICASFGLPYELVARDFAKMNYSSARVALMETRRAFALWQQHIIDQFCKVWWECVITEGVLTGKLPMPPFWNTNRDAYLVASWVPPSWGYVDPAVEIKASLAAVEANVSTPQIEASRNGLDYEHVLRQKAAALVLAREIEEEHDLEPGELTRERAERIEAVQPAPADAPAPADSGDSGDNGDNQGPDPETPDESTPPQ